MTRCPGLADTAGKIRVSPPGTISGHMKETKMIWTSQDGFAKGKSCLTSTIAFCNEMMDLWVTGECWISFTSTLAGILTVSPTVFFNKI